MRAADPRLTRVHRARISVITLCGFVDALAAPIARVEGTRIAVLTGLISYRLGHTDSRNRIAHPDGAGTVEK